LNKKFSYLIILISLILLSLAQHFVIAAYYKKFTASKDSYILQGPTYDNSNYGGSSYLFVGKYNDGTNTRAIRTLLYFPISGIPSNAVIVSAKLRLRLINIIQFSSGEVKKFYAYMLKQSWGETSVTWNNQPSRWSGIVTLFSVADTATVPSTLEINVKYAVEKWISGARPNYGLMILGDSQLGYLRFYSREYSVADYRPKLIITYKIPAIDVQATPSTATVKQGESAVYQVTVTASDYTGNVQLSVTGLPSGAVYSLNPNGGTPPFNSILTVATSATTPPGSYTLTIKGQGSGVQDTKTVKLTIIQKGDFNLLFNPSSLTLKQSESANVNIQVVSLDGYDKPVTLSLPSVPSGIMAVLGTNVVNPGSSTTLTIQASDSIAPGTYNLILKGVSDSLEHTKTLTINIEEIPYDFSINLNPPTIDVKQGEDAVVTVNLVLVSGTAKSVTLSLTGLPAGSSYAFNPETITPSGSSTLTIKTINLEGSFSITIKGTADGVEKTANLQLKVTVEKFDFDISVQPQNIEIEQGETANLLIKTTLTGGESQPVYLSLIGLPSEASHSFNPSSITPSESSILTINAGSAKGTFNIIVKGSGGGVEKTITFTITIKEKECIIATSTYGSPIEPEVEFLRSFRDNIVLSTYAGTMFYRVFNPCYYSWSPYAAHYLNENYQLKPYMRVLLHPLIFSLKASTVVAAPILYNNAELGVYMAGMIASILIGIIYLGIPIFLLNILKRRTVNKLIVMMFALFTISISYSLIAEALALDSLLMLSTAGYVISLVAIGAYIPSMILSKIRDRYFISE